MIVNTLYEVYLFCEIGMPFILIGPQATFFWRVRVSDWASATFNNIELSSHQLYANFATFGPKSLTLGKIFSENSLNLPAYNHQFLEKLEGKLEGLNMSMAQEYHFSTILPNMDPKLMLLVANACSCYWKQWSTLYQCDRVVFADGGADRELSDNAVLHCCNTL